MVADVAAAVADLAIEVGMPEWHLNGPDHDRPASCTGFGVAGKGPDDCCPYMLIIGASIGSVIACIVVVALILFLTQPRVAPLLPTPTTDEGAHGPVRITLPAHLNTMGATSSSDIEIRIFPPASSHRGTASGPGPTTLVIDDASPSVGDDDPAAAAAATAHRLRQKRKPTPALSRREFESAADSISYFTSDPPSSSRRQSTIISRYSQYAFSDLSSEADAMSSVVDAASTYMPMTDEHYRDASFLATNKTFVAPRQQQQASSRPRRTKAARMRSGTAARARLESDNYSGTSSIVESSVVSSTVTEAQRSFSRAGLPSSTTTEYTHMYNA
ncbi:Aste57867_14977 [Aphanomyces stellatus]|uniref:Aste57867_14977 protein n=1 Tax=Aphanomyces stellatus TaxID=120398 RepID=A0A485L2M4_9STRA|nr:hypothetical protein As57867_014921 [Aphanomyces stellatus]VFT91791.1 Aste57867_14977 [Aphanomyces stellatus]